MPFMIPKTLRNIETTTMGERKLFKILETILSNQCIVRYELFLGERDYRPDFTIIDRNRGVLILEVKDWGIDSIVQATADIFKIKGYHGSSFPKPQINPEKKCQIYLRNVREQLVSMPILRNSSGRLNVPVHYCIAFPNISKKIFMQKALYQIMDIRNILTQEDLINTGIPFKKKYDELLPRRAFSISDLKIQSISAALLPDIAIPHSLNPGFVKNKQTRIVQIDSNQAETYNLSLMQEQIAKSFGGGPRLLRGIAGTGKTLILLYRAKLMMSNDQTGQLRIMIVCWNISLANYMRQVYKKIQIPVQHNHVNICHFAGLIRKYLKRNFDYNTFFNNPNSMDELNALKIPESEKYDALFIDEAQDFRKEWLSFLFHQLLKGDDPKERNLIIAADDAQQIYNRDEFCESAQDKIKTYNLYQEDKFSWSTIGIPMKGRSKILKKIFRNSARVWVFAAFLLKDRASYVSENTEKVKFFSKGGYDPQLIQCMNLKEQVKKAIHIIISMIEKGYHLNNVLILYRHKQFNGFHLMSYLEKMLQQNNILYDWISEDNQSKGYFDWERDTVKISTVHSSKGMDAPIVILLGAETFVQDIFQVQPINEINLMYVAMTRAREVLVILYTGNKGLVPQLLECQKQYLKYRDAIIDVYEKK
jgi:hypothetical protein